MPITVSAEFKAIWADKQGQAVHQRLRYKRRYKLGAAYYTEAAWSVLDKPDFSAIGSIPQQADVRRNIIKTSVMTLKVPNENNQWIEHAGSPSFWAADGVATNGYKATRTLWQVQEGYMLASGSIEWISVFTGIQMRQPKITGKGEYALIEVASKALLLEKSDAEEVCEEPGLENCVPATGDGSNVDFESTSTGVDHAKLFEVNAVEKTQGSQWRVSNDSEVTSAGNTGRLAIKASVAPTAGQTVKTSVKRWFQNQLIEDLLGLLADEAGIGSADRSISPVLFPGGLSGSKTLDTEAEWEAGDTLAGVATNIAPGSIKPRWILIEDFADGDFTSNPNWVYSSSTGWSISSGRLRGVAATDALVATITGMSNTAGSWQVECDWVSGTAQFLVRAGGGYGSPPPSNPNFGVHRLTIDGTNVKFVIGGNSSDYDLITYAHVPVNGDRYRLVFETGSTKLYINEVLVGSSTDTANGAGIITSTVLGFKSSGDAYFDNVYHCPEADGASLVSEPPVFIEKWDLLSAPVGWGDFTKTETAATGWTMAYSTDVSTNDFATSDGYVAISGTTIGSLLKRYVRLKILFTQASSLRGSIVMPSVDSTIINFLTSTIYVSLANHRGRTVMQQMEQYVKLPDYELRFRGDGTLVVSPKTAGAYVVHLTQENAIIDVTEVDYGIPDRVVRSARVRYQGFVSVYNDTEAGASAETIADGDELGKGVIDEDLDQILVANDLDLGTSRARVLYENNRRSDTDPRPPVRIRLKIWDVPWLEVGDTVRVSFYDHPLLGVFQANDELLRAESPWFHAGAPGNVISSTKDWRVLYYSPNKDTGIADILVEEVL